jgi:hypothetical protein
MNALHNMLAAFRKGQVRRSAARSLYGLSGAQLADLGIPADRIEDVVDDMLMLNEHRLAQRDRTIPFPNARRAISANTRLVATTRRA